MDGSLGRKMRVGGRFCPAHLLPASALRPHAVGLLLFSGAAAAWGSALAVSVFRRHDILSLTNWQKKVFATSDFFRIFANELRGTEQRDLRPHDS